MYSTIAYGAYTGYQIGSEAVEYARLATDPSGLERMVIQHPVMTKTLSAYLVGNLFTYVGMGLGFTASFIVGKVRSKITKKRESKNSDVDSK